MRVLNCGPLLESRATVTTLTRIASTGRQRTELKAPQSHARATARSRQKAERIEQSQHDVSTSYLDVGAPSTAALRRAQLDDPECQEIRHYLAGELRHIDSPQDLKRIARLVKITSDKGGDGGPSQRRIVDEDGILYRLAGSTQHDQRRLPYVPLGLRIPIIAAFHDHMGHLSRDRTAAAIRSRYFWPGLTEDVWEYVAECHECTLAKPGRAVSRKPRGPTLGRYPFDLLYTDVLSMEESYDYNKEKGTGASKLLVFADSLSRWVEAIPLHKDPTSEQILDLFMEHVVCRYGVPRRIRSDQGRNFGSRLCEAVLAKTGVDLAPSAAEHHESVGLVERFHQTLVGMMRATDQGGGNWPKHLPFLLFAYRATPHRITGQSPAMLMFGRELRLPAQLATDEPPSTVEAMSGDPARSDATSDGRTVTVPLPMGVIWDGRSISKVKADSAAERAGVKQGDLITHVNGMDVTELDSNDLVQLIRATPSPVNLTLVTPTDVNWDYARNLNQNLQYAWNAAYRATREDQGKHLADTMRQSPGSVTTYQVGDRVARKLYGAANKLEYLYAGPYRVEEVLPGGRYKLRDLENQSIFNELDVSNLRPYRTPTKGGELADDEYIVDKLLGRRTKQGDRRVEYEVKWLGYPRSKATWEPREALEIRCNDLLEEITSKTELTTLS